MVFQNWREEWPFFLLALFAVAAGQIGRLGQKLERGDAVGFRQIIIELSMFPAFGSLTGALGVELDWPIWLILGAGITAGWLGFFTFRIIVGITMQLLRTAAKGILNSDTPPPPAPPAA